MVKSSSTTKHHYTRSLFSFHRDLRLADNHGLQAALQSSNLVIPCFILDPRQVGPANIYKSTNALEFMIESLHDLDTQLQQHGSRLFLFTGKPEVILTQLLKKHAIKAVFCNRDYTPFARTRDEELQQLCTTHYVDFHALGDALLHEPESIKKSDGKPYTLFTPFYRKAVQLPVAKPTQLTVPHFYQQALPEAENLTKTLSKLIPSKNTSLAVHGGSSQGRKILANLEHFKNYDHDKDYPAHSTTHLSAHLKFGTISIRDTYYALVTTLGLRHPLVRQLYWRDFFTHVAFRFPHVFGQAFKPQYDRLWWKQDKKLFKLWYTGTTGFPIIDAGIQELLTTGFMHNRVRMIVASFLVKDMHIDWRWGEQFFAQQLVDYDPAVNNGNWQWCASTGTDAQPYFRVFNPWLQQKKFDKECTYIKKWLPPLRTVPPSVIHTWYNPKHTPISGYPRPILDHTREVALVKAKIKRK